MDRRSLLATSLLAAMPLHAAARGQTIRTRWSVRGSEGFDALCFLGPLSGKPFYARYYPDELAAFQPRFAPAARQALATLQARADATGTLLGPGLCLLLSGGPDDNLEHLIAALDAADTRLRPPYMGSAYGSPNGWAAFAEARPLLMVVLQGLLDAGFPKFRHKVIGARLDARAPALAARLARLDMIAEQERLIGRRLTPDVEIILLWFSQPHGIRIQGQRFLTYVDYPDEIVLRNAAHEILHPPFAMDGPAPRAALRVLDRDPLIARILAEHNPAFGYNSLTGLFEEDTVQALEQIVSERLGFATPPAKRWAADDGMHVIAAGFYGLLKAEGYDRTGGRIEGWIGRAAADGRLAPAPLHAAAARVLQVAPDALWAGQVAVDPATAVR